MSDARARQLSDCAATLLASQYLGCLKRGDVPANTSPLNLLRPKESIPDDPSVRPGFTGLCWFAGRRCVPKFIWRLHGGSLANIRCPTPETQAGGTLAYQPASLEVNRTVFLSTLAFTGFAVVAGLLLIEGLGALVTTNVEASLHHGRERDRLRSSE
jgi:hypothetical protein